MIVCYQVYMYIYTYRVYTCISKYIIDNCCLQLDSVINHFLPQAWSVFTTTRRADTGQGCTDCHLPINVEVIACNPLEIRYCVHCTLYTVNVDCTLYTVNVDCTLYTVNVDCTLYTVNVDCTIYTV